MENPEYKYTPTAPVIYSPQLSDYPVQIVCPNCHAQVFTRTTYVNGFLTWLSVFLCLLFGCWFGCCCVPFFLDGCKDIHHSCPNCNRDIGTFSRVF